MIGFKEIGKTLKWPALTICKNPFDKDTEKYFEFLTKSNYFGGGQNFSSKSEFQNLLEDAFYTQSDDIVYAIGFGPDYNTAIGRSKELKIQPPYVTSDLVDFSYFGYCSTVHFEALRKKMIEKGEIAKDAIDSKFFVVIGLKVTKF